MARLLLVLGLIFQKVTRLAVEDLADLLQRLEADAAHLAGLQKRHVLLRDADPLGKDAQVRGCMARKPAAPTSRYPTR